MVAAVVALVYLAFGVINAPANEHRVQLELIDESTSWPWHSSIQRASAVWINSAAGQQWAGNALVRAEQPRNIVELVIVATGSTAQESAKSADETAAGFISHDVLLRAEPVQLRIDALSAELANLEAEFAAQEEAVGIATNAAQITARSTRLEGTAALIGALEGQRSEAETELAAQLTRYEIVDSGPISPVQNRLPETLKLLAGLGFVLFLAQVVVGARSGSRPGSLKP